MSIVGDFVKGMSGAAMTMLGLEAVAIDGGAEFNAVLSEIESQRDYEGGAFSPGTMLMAVATLADWTLAYPNGAQTYLGKDATARDKNFTVGRIKIGAEFVEIELVDEEAAR